MAVKLTSKEPLDEAKVMALAEEMMLNVARLCVDHGARFIGHIKAHVRTDAGTVKADTIGVAHGAFSSGSIERPVTDLYMAVNSIVQGIHQDEVKQATLDGIHQAALSWKLLMSKEKEHAYFDEFDFTASKEQYRLRLEEQLATADLDDPFGENKP